ncbi:hypothetical protein B0T22DRAFT_480677 [Podospora appendiculata]|uniref:Uncharacterized protein n=1 Tax=Podospora appendiculata TaxID=314037 RepID=A0AAE0XBW3_9PEZI|nr:hypothetical protein B0T22DRAFT_480677 [Podospora appendiculata]
MAYMAPKVRGVFTLDSKPEDKTTFSLAVDICFCTVAYCPATGHLGASRYVTHIGKGWKVCIWTFNPRGTLQLSFEIAGYNKGRVDSLAFSPDGRSLVANIMAGDLAGVTCPIDIVKTRNGGRRAEDGRLRFIPGNNRLVSSGFMDGKIRVWAPDNARGFRETQVLEEESVSPRDVGVSSLSLSSDGKWLAWVNHVATTIRIWAVDANEVWRLIQKMESRDNRLRIWSVAFSPGVGQLQLLAGCSEGAILSWVARDGGKLEPAPIRNGPLRDDTKPAVEELYFSPDGSYLATIDASKSLAVWKVGSVETT